MNNFNQSIQIVIVCSCHYGIVTLSGVVLFTFRFFKFPGFLLPNTGYLSLHLVYGPTSSGIKTVVNP